MLVLRVGFGILLDYFSSKSSLVWENAFLRYQVGVLKRSPKRPLIWEIAYANPLWGAPRIHGELLKLGVNIAQSTVEKYLKRTRWPRPISQNWKTFVKNHSKSIIAMDFFMVPNVFFKRLYVLVILSHDRRKILSFGANSSFQIQASEVVEKFSISFGIIFPFGCVVAHKPK